MEDEMGTLAEEMSKVKAVLTEWDNQDAQANQPQENTMEKKRTTVSKVMEFIVANPGINSLEIRKRVLAKYPEIQESHISSTLKQVTDSYHVTREAAVPEKGHITYNYTAVPDEVRLANKKAAKERYKAAVARAEKARAAKAAKAAERESVGVQLGISDLVPQPIPTTATHNTAPTIKSTWTAKEALDGLSVLQARELYIELKQIFGG
jgi:hypothetical protein